MNKQPTYEELYQWYEEEKRIKNHLYYYILIKGLLNSYYAYYQAYANEIEEKEKQDGKMLRILLMIDATESCMNSIIKPKKVNVEFDIMPN